MAHGRRWFHPLPLGRHPVQERRTIGLHCLAPLGPSVMLYRHTLPEGGSVPGSDSGTCLVRRMAVARRAAPITVYGIRCAEDIGTSQILCCQRNLAIGEVVGLKMNDRIWQSPLVRRLPMKTRNP